MKKFEKRTTRQNALIFNAAIMVILDILAILFSYVAVHVLHHFPPHDVVSVQIATPNIIQTIYRFEAYAVISLIIFFLSLKNGHYSHYIPWWNQVRILIIAILICILTEGFASFIFHIPSPPLLIISNWLLCGFFIIFLRRIYFYLRPKFKKWSMDAVIAGDASTVLDILYAFNSDPATVYDVKTVFVDSDKGVLNVEEVPKRYSDIEIELSENFENYIAVHPDCFYIFAPDIFPGSRRDEITKKLNAAKTCYAIIPTSPRIDFYDMTPRYFFGSDVMLLVVKNQLTRPVANFVKRSMDVMISFIGLLLFILVFPFIVLALKLEKHEGSIFYGGERIGQNGKLFKCWKFRTMCLDSEAVLKEYFEQNLEAKTHWQKYFKLPHDPRVKTRTGRILRKWSLDEIPQLINVLKGNMSLVGPRPILPDQTEAYSDCLADYMRVKPGITGLWQVSGRNAVSFQRRIYWDCWYVRNWSVWGDIVIMLKTILAVLFRRDGH